MSTLSESEQTYRRELNRSVRAALAEGLTFEQYQQRRAERIEQWAQWLAAEMQRCGAFDPSEVLPHALARLQDIVVAEAKAAIDAAMVAARRS